MFYKQNFPLMDMEYDTDRHHSGGNSSGKNYEKGLQEIAKTELCKNEDDIINCETTNRIIGITANKAGVIINAEKIDEEIIDIYIKFIKNEPLTLKQRNYLLAFFQDEKVGKITQILLSKLLIVQGDENSKFIDGFLKDSNGKFDIKKVLEYLINSLINYKYLIDIDGKIEKLEKGGNFYSYKIKNGKYGVFIIENDEIFCLNGVFNSIKYLGDGVVFGIKENEIKNQNSPGYDKNIGIFYRFNGHDFEEFGKTSGIIGVENLYDDYYYLSIGESGKKGLLQIQKNQEDKYSISSIIIPNHDKININSGFILTSDEIKNGEIKIGVYIKTNGNIKKILEENCIDNSFCFIPNIPQKRNYIGNFENITGNYYILNNKSGDYIYRYFEKEQEFDLVPGFDMINEVLTLDNLFNGKPTYISYNNGERGIYVFNNGNGILRCLIKIKDSEVFNSKPKINGDILKIESLRKIKIFFWKNGVLYDFKKPYKYVNIEGTGFIKKGIFGKAIPLTNSFEDMKEYLEESYGTITI